MRIGLGLPSGLTLIADPVPDDGPAVLWQCGYQSETELARAESAIPASPEYGEASGVVRELATLIEIELYTAEDEVDREAQA